MSKREMTYPEAIEILRKHNEWRRYDGPIDKGPEMTDPKMLGEAIDTVVSEKHPALKWEDINTILYLFEEMKEEIIKERLDDRTISEIILKRLKEDEQ